MKKGWSELSITAKIIIIIVIVIIVFLLFKKFLAWYKLHQSQSILNNSTTTTVINNQPVSINLGSVAQQIHAAFHDYYYGLAEDEAAAMAALSGVPKALIPQLSDIYFKLYSANLNQEFVDYLSDSDYAKIQYLFI